MNTRPLAFATGVVGIATVLAWGGRWSWACELFVNFRTHYAMFFALAMLLAAVARNWRIAVAATVGLVVNLWPMWAVVPGAAAPLAAGGRTVRVAELNVYFGNRDLSGVAAYLDSLSPDVVVLEEVTAASADELARRLPRLGHRFRAIDPGVRGVSILSRLPLIAPRPIEHDGQMFGVRADVDLGDRRLRLYGMHFNWPIVPASYGIRNAQLSALGRELAGCTRACAVVGDFNTTPWSSHFRDLLQVSGFRDCASGRGWLPTWPSGLPALLRIRIDHCLASTAVSVRRLQVGRGAGSDHLATVQELSVH